MNRPFYMYERKIGNAGTTKTVTIGPSTAESRGPSVLAAWVITIPPPVTQSPQAAGPTSLLARRIARSLVALPQFLSTGSTISWISAYIA